MLTSVVLQLALTVSPVALPGTAPVSMDYLAFDHARQRVWIPAGNTGNIDVLDVRTRALSTISGAQTADSPRPDRPRLGPSSVTIGKDSAWVGNRAARNVCAYDATTLKLGACVALPEMPDAVVYVPATDEVWATTPHTQRIAVIDATKATLRPDPISMPGEPEGYAVGKERFYTNLEDRNRTLVIDVKTKRVVATYEPGCSEAGPRGLVADEDRGLLIVACTDGVVTLDLRHGGKVLARAHTGAGVDDLAYRAHRLYVASGADATLRVFDVSDRGLMTLAASVATGPGARNAVVDDEGVAYVAEGRAGRVLVVTPSKQ